MENSADGPPDGDAALEVPELLSQPQNPDRRPGLAQNHCNLEQKKSWKGNLKLKWNKHRLLLFLFHWDWSQLADKLSSFIHYHCGAEFYKPTISQYSPSHLQFTAHASLNYVQYYDSMFRVHAKWSLQWRDSNPWTPGMRKLLLFKTSFNTKQRNERVSYSDIITNFFLQIRHF